MPKLLNNKTIVLTRPKLENAGLRKALVRAGVRVLECPALRVESLLNTPVVKKQLAEFITNNAQYDGVIFLSQNAVRLFFKGLGKNWRLLKNLKVYAVGPVTAQLLRVHGVSSRVVPAPFRVLSFLKILKRVSGDRYLLPRVCGGPQDLKVAFRKRGGEIVEIPLYKTAPAPAPAVSIRKRILASAAGVVFTSAKSVAAFMSFFSGSERKELFRNVHAFAIGPTTAARLHELGLKKVATAKVATSEGLVSLIKSHQ